MPRPRPSVRSIVLFVLWLAPSLVYLIVGIIAVYQTGWLAYLAVALPLLWILAWLIPKLWTTNNGAYQTQLPEFERPSFWTETDSQAIKVVETYRKKIIADRNYIFDTNRYLEDASALASVLSAHYHKSKVDKAFHPITLVEVLCVIHLASEDIEHWTIKNVPGSNLLTVGHFARMSDYARYFDNGQKAIFLISSIAKPMKLVFYPLWRKSSAVTDELQNDAAQLIYQQYLRTVGFYLIEMFSGRLRAGSKEYREKFGRWSNAMHQIGGNKAIIDSIGSNHVTIAVMGQVKAGKSSLINALLMNQAAATNILPETRQVQRYTYKTPSGINVELLDTPGYSEADVSARQRHEVEIATEAADIVLLVLAAHTPAKDADVRMVMDIQHYYRERSHLKPPKIIGVLTHIDLLRPVREWNPPYHWRHPKSLKEQSMAATVQYCRELFGDHVVDYACVYTGSQHQNSAVIDELVPLIMNQLSEGEASALLKAFYAQLSKDRLLLIKNQFKGLMRSFGNWITEKSESL